MQNQILPLPRRIRLRAAHVACWLLLVVCAPAAWGADQYARDTDFLRRAEDVGNRQIASGRRAIQRSTRPDVVKAAEQLRVMGETATTELARLAVEKGWPMPADTAPDSGAAYTDREFVSHAIEVAQNALAFYKEEAANGRDTDLQTYARRMVPEIERCLVNFRALHAS